MTRLLRLANRMRRIARIDDEGIALRRVREATQAAEERERAQQDAAALAMQRRLASRAPSICLGTSVRSDGDPFNVYLTEEEVRSGGHWLLAGATGAGKSYLILSIIMQLLRRRASGLCIIDAKGELASLVRDVVLPSLVASLPERKASELLRNVAVIAPFDENATPPFQLLSREPRLPIEVQAHEVATSFGRTIGSDLGALQQHALLKGLMLAIDVGLTVPDVADLFRDPDLRRGALERTSLPEVKTYFERQFSRERGASIAGLLSRLDSIVMYPSLRRMLRAPGMVRFDQLLERAVTIVDLGRAPAGMGELTRFFGQLIFVKLMRAIFDRRLTDTTLPVTIIADEFQQLLMPEVARNMEQILALIRSQKVHLWAMFQQAAQIDAVSPTLLRILRTNTNYQLLMRSDISDALVLAHALPITGQSRRDASRFPDPRTTEPVMTVDEERRRLAERIPTMPDRMFWFWDRRAQYPAILTRSATLNVDQMRRQAARLPEPVRRAIRRGVLALDADELQQAEAERLAKREELARAPTASRRAEPLTSEKAELPSEPSELPPDEQTPTEEGVRGLRRRRRIDLG